MIYQRTGDAQSPLGKRIAVFGSRQGMPPVFLWGSARGSGSGRRIAGVLYGEGKPGRRRELMTPCFVEWN